MIPYCEHRNTGRTVDVEGGGGRSLDETLYRVDTAAAVKSGGIGAD